MKRVALALLISCFGATALAETTLSNIVYAWTTDTDEPLLLDCYVPTGATGEMAVLLLLHSGGWEIGDKVAVPTFVREKSWIVCSANYRLTSAPVAGNTTRAGIWPRQIQDVRAAIRYLRRLGIVGTPLTGSVTIDPDRIGLFGVSAGGHLAVYAALIHGTDDVTIDNPPNVLPVLDSPVHVSCAVNAIVASVPVIDLTVPTPGVAEATYLADATTYQAKLLGGSVGSRLALAAMASPSAKVRGDAPPIFILNRTSDELIEPSQASDFASAMIASVNSVTLRTEPGTHATVLSAGDQAAILAFLAANL